MSQIQISLAEKPILNYLRDGGDINSDGCVVLVADFIKKSLRDDDVRSAYDNPNYVPYVTRKKKANIGFKGL